jgi:hypothetical protein
MHTAESHTGIARTVFHRNVRSLRFGGLTLLVVAFSGTASAALADPYHPTDQDKAAARPLGTEGLELASKGDCRGAVDRLGRAEALVHAPTTAVPLAECDIQLGKVVAGIQLLDRVLGEPLAPNAPPPWIDAKQHAQQVRDAARGRVAKLRIHLEGPQGAADAPQVTLDGQSVPVTLLDTELSTDPGAHHVVARQGALTAETDVSLGDGQSATASLNLLAQTGYPPQQGYQQPPAAYPPPQGYAQQPGGYPPGPPPPGNGAYVQDGPAPWIAVEFGVRLAFGFPFGGLDGANGDSLDQVVNNMPVPLWLDGGVRLASHWYVGGYFTYGLTALSDKDFGGNCKQPGVGCSSNDIRLGVNGQYHVLPDGRFDPWFGAGFGYEWFSATESPGNTTFHSGFSGWEFLNLQAGLDFRLLDGALGIGPFMAFTIDQYSSQSIPDPNGDGGTTGQSVSNQALHEWLLFGARGDFDLKIK